MTATLETRDRTRITEPGADVHPVSAMKVVNSEWIKFRTLRSSWAVLGAAVLGMLAIGMLIAYNTRHLSPRLDANDLVPSATLQGYYLGQLLIGSLGVLLVTGEFSTGMISSTFTAVPRRLPVLWAKLAVFTGVTAVSMTAISVITFLASQAFVHQYRASFSLSSPGALRVVLGTGLYLTLVGLIGAMIGWIVRSTPGALVTFFGLLLVIPIVFGNLLGSWGSHLAQYLPSSAGADFASSVPGSPHLSGWAGLIVVLAWIVVLGVVALVSLRRRDAWSGTLIAMDRARLRPLARYPLLADTALAALVAAFTVLPDVLGPDHHSHLAALWDVGLALPLVLRRRTPASAAAMIGALCLAQWIVGVLINGDFAVLVMLYTLGAWEQRRWVRVSAIVVSQLGVFMAVTRWAPQPHPWVSGLLLTGTVTASWVLGAYVRTRRAYVASMLERAETAERERDSQARIAVATERARMAREMHDIIAHSLSVMITLNDAAAAVAPTDTLRRTVTQASEVGRQALGEMQRMLGVLRGDEPADLAPQPGTAQLADLVAIVRSAGLSVELVVSGDPGALAPSAELAVYRIVQESLTNVLKHASNVSHVGVELTYRADRTVVRVHNDGDAVVVGAAHGAPAGHGLAGMRERVGLYGGEVEARPVPSGGWLVLADLPVPAPVVAR